MLQPNFLPLITFIFWSWWTLNGVVSDPQTSLLEKGCSPSNSFISSNFSIFSDNVNKTFQDIREQLINKNKYFATAQQANAENPVFTLFQCRNYLSIHDCVACFDEAAAKEVRDCPAGALGGRALFDGCFLRYETSSDFFQQTTENFNTVTCGNETVRESTTEYTSVVQQVLMNLQTTTPKTQGLFTATKAHLPDNIGTTIYAFAQCVQTITQSGCQDCLKAGYSNMQICLPNLDARALAAGCFMRYSTTSFFPDDYQTIDITPLGKQGSNKKWAIIGVVAGGLAFVLILLTVLLAWIKRPKRHERSVSRGDISGVSKLKGLINYSYRELKFATKNFSAENKLGEGGFGAVYKGILKNGKVVAVKKLRQSKKVEEEFESEVKLIRNVHHRNLIRLLGCCSEGNERILIYEYMKNTSLDKFLFARILHEDKSHVSTRLAGTLGYTAPEYAIQGHLSEKVDIYSYGVVVLEIISGKKCTEYSLDCYDEGAFLLQKAWKLYEKGKHIELADKTLNPDGYDEEEVKKIIEIGLLCTQAYANTRPMMSEVVAMLQNKDLLEDKRPTMPILIETN